MLLEILSTIIYKNKKSGTAKAHEYLHIIMPTTTQNNNVHILMLTRMNLLTPQLHDDHVDGYWSPQPVAQLHRAKILNAQTRLLISSVEGGRFSSIAFTKIDMI